MAVQTRCAPADTGPAGPQRRGLLPRRPLHPSLCRKPAAHLVSGMVRVKQFGAYSRRQARGSVDVHPCGTTQPCVGKLAMGSRTTMSFQEHEHWPHLPVSIEWLAADAASLLLAPPGAISCQHDHLLACAQTGCTAAGGSHVWVTAAELGPCEEQALPQGLCMRQLAQQLAGAGCCTQVGSGHPVEHPRQQLPGQGAQGWVTPAAWRWRRRSRCRLARKPTGRQRRQGRLDLSAVGCEVVSLHGGMFESVSCEEVYLDQPLRSPVWAAAALHVVVG